MLKQIDSQCELHGEDNVANLINECMASNYKGIIFDKLKTKERNNPHDFKRPAWLDMDL